MAKRPGVTAGRELGEHELLLNYIHQIGGLIVLSVLHVRGPVQPEGLRAALEWVQTQHPLLQVHVRYRRLAFRNVPPFIYLHPIFVPDGTTEIPLALVENEDPLHWRQVMTHELRTPLRRGKSPRLRVTLVRTTGDDNLSHIVICGDHATLDAHSVNC